MSSEEKPCISVGGLSWDTTERHLQDAFGRFGKVMEAQAKHLIMVYHKNPVTLIGYYKDDNNLALVYEYMDQGTFQEHLSGKSCSVRPLSWGKRLQIALEAAQGCRPPIIHRDVKASNILLIQKLEAKISNFGLSRAFLNGNDTHVSTKIDAGTIGYIDPTGLKY